ncbi:hypothetical protein OHB01_04695 [Microbispora hainanensis]|uniref:hypothetical protein n=1 Tax=Microbispora hainanensis TaxID=568844 RepID=UPI002E2BB48E|nr:hypothetical protein [Microbispora hainanensis]
MIGRVYLRAASSAAASVAIATLAVLAVGPMIGANAEPVEPCDPTTDPQCAVVTVTVTQTPPVGSSPSASPTAEPVVTKTITITPTPSPSKSPKPVTTTTAPPASTTEQNTGQNTGQSIPTLTDTPVTDPPSPTPEDDGEVSLAPASTGPTPDAAQQSPTPSGVTFEQPDPQTVPIEIRNATPEYDKPTLAHRLAIPAGVLVGIALIAWLIFEGRLRRMAHAAAVRRGGPAAARTPAPEAAAAAYPAAAAPGYAPMVGFVPVQPYTVGYAQQPYGYPVQYGYPQPYGYPVADPAQMQAQMQAQQQAQMHAQPDPWAEATRSGNLPQQPHGPEDEDPTTRR